MADQLEGGWPLGLQPLNARVGLVRNVNIHDRNGSISFSTLLTASPATSSTHSSSDLDTESNGSFFRKKSITLGSLIGVSKILDLSRRSIGGRPRTEALKEKKSHKPRPWIFSLCSKLSTDAVNMSNTPSLAHFLEAERRAANIYRRNHGPALFGPDVFSQIVDNSGSSSLFVGANIAPPTQASYGYGYGSPLSLSRLCGQITH